MAAFLSIIGGKNYTLLRNILSPQKPSDKSLEDLFAEHNTQQLKWDSTVHSVKLASAKEKECYRCSRKNHLPAECRFKDA